jgi:hypothetical protein
MPALAYHGSRKEKRAVAQPGDYRAISSRLPLVPIHLSARSANLIAIGFASAIPRFRRDTAEFDAAPRPRPRLRDILRAAVDMSKRRIRHQPRPQSGTIAGLFIAPRRTDHAIRRVIRAS